MKCHTRDLGLAGSLSDRAQPLTHYLLSHRPKRLIVQPVGAGGMEKVNAEC